MIDSCFAADHNEFDEHDNLSSARTTPSGGSTRWRSTRRTTPAPRRDGARASSTPTATARFRPGGPSPISRSIRSSDHRIEFGCYAIALSPTDGSIWCSGIGHKDTTLVRLERGANPPQSCKAEVYIPPPSKALAPVFGWRRRRQQRRGLAELARGPRDPQLRPPQVQGAQRTDCHGTAVPRGVDGVHEAWSLVQRVGTVAEVSTDMLYLTNIDHHDALGLGKDVLLAGDVNADSFFVLHAAERPDEDLDLARAVSARIPCASHRWTHRRSEWRLEGARHVVELLDVHAVAPGRRQGSTAEGCEVPGPPESSREIASMPPSLPRPCRASPSR